MKAKIILTVSFVLLSGLILFLRFNQSGNASREDRTQGYPTIEKRITAPRFVSQDLKGRKVTLDDYKGKVVFLGFWTTQWPWCRKELPSIEKLKNRLKGSPFQIVMVNDGESSSTVRNFIESNGYTFQVVLDSDGAIDKQYHVFGHPMSFILDKKGKFVFSALGYREWYTPEMIKAFKKLANEP